jgi:1-acyl-sn-glycerol-3-phosphate acyltransferase
MIFWLIKITIGNFIKLIWLNKVTGLENIPKKKAFIISANHLSYFDFLMLAAVCPRRIYFLAGEVFFRKWQWKWLVKATKQIKVDRNSKDKSKSIKEVIKYLKEGKVIGIFPEGTRSADGKIHDFYNGAVRIALKSKVPIVPVGIKGTYEIMSKFDKFPKFNKKCDINFGKLISYNNKVNDKSLLVDSTKVLMEKVVILCNKI